MLTFLVPGGSYTWIKNQDGNLVIDTASPFTQVQGGLPFWKWVLSPIWVLTVSGARTIELFNAPLSDCYNKYYTHLDPQDILQEISKISATA